MLLLAHRGASANAPENTLEAFEQAITQKADGVELDVQRCSTGELVVCHDEILDRLAGVPWDLRRTPWSRLKTLDVGSKLGFKPARIPLLEEVFELLPPRMLVNVEIKCDTFEDAGLSVAVAELVLRRGEERRTLISSFNPLCLFRLAGAAPELKRGFLIDPDKSHTVQANIIAPLVSTYSIHPHHGALTPDRIKAWQALGWKVCTWTANDVDLARSLESLGVDVCITDAPKRLREGLRSARVVRDVA
jgi:glycerophosphoryl diester phosphodiesterase